METLSKEKAEQQKDDKHFMSTTDHPMPEEEEDLVSLLGMDSKLISKPTVENQLHDSFRHLIEQKLSAMKSVSVINPRNLPHKEGHLMKNFAGEFKKYWIELEEKELSWYEEDTEGNRKLVGVLNFELYQVTIVIENDEFFPSFHLKVLGCDHHFYFKSVSEQDARKDLQEWIVAIGKHIQVSQGAKQRLEAPQDKKLPFWHHQQITTEQFIDMADTFDIVLFTCKSMGGSVIRSYLKSDFDHVGMILKFDAEPDEVYILESTSNSGVHLKRFKSVVPNMGQFYDKITLRQLKFVRRDHQMIQLDKFLQDVLGNSYKFKLEALSFKRQQTKKYQDPNHVVQEGRTFFCSELIAKAYKVCDIIEDQGEACSNYLPQHFTSQSFGLNLMQNVNIKGEKTIIRTINNYENLPPIIE